MHKCVVLSAALAAVLLAFTGTVQAAELVLAPSPAVKQKIEAGEAADVILVQPDFAGELAKSGKVSAGDRPMIGPVGIGLGARSDSRKRDISTPEKLKQTLLGVDTLSFNRVRIRKLLCNGA